MKMKTLYADLNDFDSAGTLPLTCAGSIESISGLNGSLTDGEEILLSDGDVRAIARVYRVDDRFWEARDVAFIEPS